MKDKIGTRDQIMFVLNGKPIQPVDAAEPANHPPPQSQPNSYPPVPPLRPRRP